MLGNKTLFHNDPQRVQRWLSFPQVFFLQKKSSAALEENKSMGEL